MMQRCLLGIVIAAVLVVLPALGKPIVLHSLYNFTHPHALDLLRYYGIPVHDSVEIACTCIEVLARYGQYRGSHQRRTSFVLDWGRRARSGGREIINRACGEGRRSLLENEAKRLVSLHGAPTWTGEHHEPLQLDRP